MKQRFSSLDVKVIAHELSHALCTLRLANVYDLSSRIFLLKFAKPDCRQSLLIDVGFRCHLTDFGRDTASTPSAFVARVRKFLRSQRVTSVAQVGTDRIIELQFRDGQLRLFLEFYAGGNIILTNQDLSILALFRAVSPGPNQEELRVGLKYSLDNRQILDDGPLLTVSRIKSGLQAFLEKSPNASTVSTQKFKKKSGDALRKALSSTFSEFPPALLDHALRVADFDKTIAVENVIEDSRTLEALFDSLKEAERISASITGSTTTKGYIIAKAQRSGHDQHHEEQVDTGKESSPQGLIYEDFQPFRPRQYESDASVVEILEFEGFNKTVDEFFSSVESQKLESRIVEREEHAKKKLENAKQDHEKRLDGLQKVQELNVRKAQAIEADLPRVQEAITAVNSLVAQGIGWPEIAQLIEMEKQRHNPVAEMIHLPLKLYENTVTLLLTEADFEDEADFEGDETDSDISDTQEDESNLNKSGLSSGLEQGRLPVDVDLDLSPWSNARQYYDQKKTAASKEQRTIQASERALKSTERKINADLKKGLTQEKEVLRPLRKPFWFEKFFYFISSEGFLVLAGKDTQQSEIIYRKYLTKGDVYVHADLQGAASTIIKNKPGQSGKPIPPSTLSQAGTFTVCTSSAWDSKSVMAAWWVHADQVSKTSPGGEFLPIGVFSIRSEKNFLPPAQLLLGIGLMFKISEESKARHFKNRLAIDPETSSDSMPAQNDDTPGQDQRLEDSNNRPGGSQGENNPSESQIRVDEDQENGESTFERHGGDEIGQDDFEFNRSTYNALQPDGLQRSVSPDASPHYSNPDLSHDKDSDEDEAVENDLVETESVISDGNELEETHSTTDGPSDGVRHVSAHQRKTLRKGQQLAPPEEDQDPSTAEASSPKPTMPEEGKKGQAVSQPQVRGKKGKRNKIKTKYADQDDEERALAMRLLGSASAERKAQEDVEANVKREEKQADDRERRRKQQNAMIEKGKQAEQKRQRLFQDGDEEAEDGEAEIDEDLDAFVGTVLPGDEILDTLIVCAPWDAIGNRCRWKAKLQPGSVKKGKAVKEILGAWNATLKGGDKRKQPEGQASDEAAADEENARKREAELVRAVREPDMVGAVPVGKVRLMIAAGGAGSKARGGGAAGRGRRGGKGSKRN